MKRKPTIVLNCFKASLTVIIISYYLFHHKKKNVAICSLISCINDHKKIFGKKNIHSHALSNNIFLYVVTI